MICPFMSKNRVVTTMRGTIEDKEVVLDRVECLQGDCQLWVAMYTTEGHSDYGCAFAMNALKNSNGQIPV